VGNKRTQGRNEIGRNVFIGGEKESKSLELDGGKIVKRGLVILLLSILRMWNKAFHSSSLIS
jgi:hypothetical protein